MNVRARLQGTKRSDGRWQIILTDTAPDGSKVKTHIVKASQREAQDAALEHRRLAKRRAPSPRTVADLVDACRRERWPHLAPRSVERYEQCMVRILARFGQAPVQRLKPVDVTRWLVSLAAEPKLSGRGVQMHRNVLSVVLKHGRDNGWCDINAAEVGLPPGVSAKPKPRTAVTEAMYRLLRIREADPVLRDLWCVLAECGLRPAEALSLTDANLTKVKGVWWLSDFGTKTAASSRSVPVPAWLGDRLALRKGRWFAYDVSNLHRAWAKRLAGAGLEHTNLYQLRKLALSRWVAAGLPDEVVKTLAGHADINLTKTVYYRPTNGVLMSAFERLGMARNYVSQDVRVSDLTGKGPI